MKSLSLNSKKSANHWRSSSSSVLSTSKQHVITLAALLFLGSTSASANTFGHEGRHGNTGHSGRDGRSGQSIVLKADGTPGTYDISGTDGSDGSVGENGYSATNCSQPSRPAYNLQGARGGDGGQGGRGGNGGNGGALTVYFNDISQLKNIAVRGTPGEPGRSGWGGRGGEGCHCSEGSWTINDSAGSPQTYSCSNGEHGRDASGGNQGSRGHYGQVILINQMQPVAAEVEAMHVDMAKMEQSTYTVSKNHWELRQGADALFARGTDLANQYYLFKGRTEASIKFRWQAARPITDFSRWQMLIRLENKEAKVYFPDGVWMDSEVSIEDGQKVFTIKSIVAGNEIPYIQLESFTGEGADHTITIKDSAGMSEVLQNSLHAEFWTIENGQWKKHFDAAVPDSALTIDPNHIKVSMGKVGIDPAVFKIGKQAFVKFLVTRKLGQNSARYELSSNYVIKIQIVTGDAVEAVEDANLLYGNQIVGQVKKGEKFTISQTQGDWARIKKLDGTLLDGWISIASLRKN